jgi:nucleoid-associated protein YgaU
VVVATAVVGEDSKWTVRYAAPGGEHAMTVKIQGQAGEGSTGASATVAVPVTAGGHSYVVKNGDWLMSLARRYYGDSLRWVEIYDATNAKAVQDPSYHKLKNPSYLLPGWKLWIPEP